MTYNYIFVTYIYIYLKSLKPIRVLIIKPKYYTFSYQNVHIQLLLKTFYYNHDSLPIKRDIVIESVTISQHLSPIKTSYISLVFQQHRV